MTDYVIEPVNGPAYQLILTDATREQAIEEAVEKNRLWLLPVVVMEGTRERKTVALVDCQRIKAGTSASIDAGRSLLDDACGNRRRFADVVSLKRD